MPEEPLIDKERVSKILTPIGLTSEAQLRISLMEDSLEG